MGDGRRVRATILISDTLYHPYTHCYKFWRNQVTLGSYVNGSYLNDVKFNINTSSFKTLESLLLHIRVCKFISCSPAFQI